MANVMSVEKRNQILRMLVEGNSIRSVCRLMQTQIRTVLRQLVWAGEHCQSLMDAKFQGLTLDHLETDEMWTFVAKKQNRLTIDERRERSDIGDVYLWYSIDQETKLVPTFLLGKRNADNARRFMVDLRSRLAMPTPRPHDTDPHAFIRPAMPYATQISTDGFAPYPEAVDLAFGPYVKFGTIVKDYKNATLPYTPSEIVGTKRRAVFGMNESEKRSICTSHVERHNLTVRTFMKRFTRLALGFSKKLANLEAACALHFAYYNFCWRPGEMRITPAMAAGVTDRLWNFDELLS